MIVGEHDNHLRAQPGHVGDGAAQVLNGMSEPGCVTCVMGRNGVGETIPQRAIADLRDDGERDEADVRRHVIV